MGAKIFNYLFSDVCSGSWIQYDVNLAEKFAPMEKIHMAPFVVKPMRINNYTHLIALLKAKQAKYSDCTYGAANHSFSKALSPRKEALDLNSILDGFLHQKLKKRAEEYEDAVDADLSKSLASKIKELKSENDLKIHGSRIGDLRDVEGLLFLKPSASTFKDELLFDLYTFINRREEPLVFLERSYLKFIKKFFTEDRIRGLDCRTESIECKDGLKDLVREFVKMRFNREEFNIEVYESRYLWAEIFVLYRIGRIDLVKEMLSEFEIFFEFMAQKFRTVFLGFLSERKSNFIATVGNEDKFKKFLFDLADGRAKSDGHVIGTVEDYLWLKMVMGKEIRQEMDQFENNRIKFMISIFARKYNEAIDILLKSDFGIVSKFFLLRELCLEQSLDHVSAGSMPIAILGSARKNVARAMEDGSSTISMDSAHSMASSAINPIFLNFLFNVVSRLSTKEHKVKLIEMLKHHSEYYDIVPDYIIRYNLFDILGRQSGNASEIEFALDDRMASRVLQRLKESGDKQRLVQLHHLIDDLGMVRLLVEVVEEAILSEDAVDKAIVEKYLQKKVSADSERLRNIYNFYKFSKHPSSATLKATVIFDQDMDLEGYKFAIEKIFPMAVDVVKGENDKFMAKCLFRLCGLLALNEECVDRASKHLVMLI